MQVYEVSYPCRHLMSLGWLYLLKEYNHNPCNWNNTVLNGRLVLYEETNAVFLTGYVEFFTIIGEFHR